MWEGTTWRVTAADRPYGEFYDFYSVSPKILDTTLYNVMELCITGIGRCCCLLNRTVFHARSFHDIYLHPSCGKPSLLLCDVDLVSFSISNGFATHLAGTLLQLHN